VERRKERKAYGKSKKNNEEGEKKLAAKCIEINEISIP
jgi:hypothetical protein